MVPSIPITRTKIIIPRRRQDLLSRQRLLNYLDEALDNRLIIVAAPAGYGKTSLLVDFVHQSTLPVCWLSLDPLDQDPQRFIAHFISSLQFQFPQFGQTSWPALENMPQDKLNLNALVSFIVNDAFETIGEHFLIVIDDYHLVEGVHDINYFLNQFLMTVDENCHVLISSRRLLPLPDMTLLVARSMVGGLGFEDLAFNTEEIQNLYLQNHRLTISATEASELATLTEGWITGLILSTQINSGRVTTRFQNKHISGVSLYDYLAQQVLEHQKPEVKQFLYQTSVLEEFDAELCRQVIGQSLGIDQPWDTLMRAIQENNLFVLPLVEENGDRVWLRYHHLFRDFLQSQFQKLAPDESRKIQIRLAEYYQESGEWDRAFQLYDRLDIKDRIAAMIESAGQAMVARGQLITLQKWFEQIPETVMDRSARLLSIRGATQVMLGEIRSGIQLFDQALKITSHHPDPEIEGHTLVRRAGALRFVGEYGLSLQDAEKALDLTIRYPDLKLVRATALHAKGWALYQNGNLNDALEWFVQAKETFLETNSQENAIKVTIDIALLHRYLGDFSTAEQLYKEVLAYYQTTQNIVWQANLLNNLGVLHYLGGDYLAALDELEKSIHYARMGGYQRLEAYALTSLGDLFKDIRAHKEANQAYVKAESILDTVKDQFLEFYLCLASGELELARGHLTTAETQFQEACQMAVTAQSQFETHLCNLSRARHLILRGSYSQAADLLRPTAEFFVREGHHVEANRAQLLIGSAFILGGFEREGQKALQMVVPVLARGEMRSLYSVITPVEKFFPAEEVGGDPKNGPLASLVNLYKQHEQTLPSLRKQLRRQSELISISAPELSIITFGKIQTKLGDHVISGAEWQSQNARDLLLLLLVHKEGLTKEEIGEIFWPGSSPAELKLRFKNTIYRLRHAAGKDVILFNEDIYTFNYSMDYEADFETFEREIQAAKEDKSPAGKINHYSAAIRLYKGPFLGELSDLWVFNERDRLEHLYVDAMIQTTELLLEQGSLTESLDYAQKLLKEDPCHELMHQLAMRAYAALDNQAAVKRQFEICQAALSEELGTEPSAQTRNLYQILTRERRKYQR